MRLCTDDNALYTLIPMTNNPLCHCEPLFNCHCGELKPRAQRRGQGVAIPGKQNSKSKMQNDRVKMKKQSAVSSQQSAVS